MPVTTDSFCETRTERSVEVFRVEIVPPPPHRRTRHLGTARYRRARHLNNDVSLIPGTSEKPAERHGSHFSEDVSQT